METTLGIQVLMDMEDAGYSRASVELIADVMRDEHIEI